MRRTPEYKRLPLERKNGPLDLDFLLELLEQEDPEHLRRLAKSSVGKG